MIIFIGLAYLGIEHLLVRKPVRKEWNSLEWMEFFGMDNGGLKLWKKRNWVNYLITENHSYMYIDMENIIYIIYPIGF